MQWQMWRRVSFIYWWQSARDIVSTSHITYSYSVLFFYYVFQEAHCVCSSRPFCSARLNGTSICRFASSYAMRNHRSKPIAQTDCRRRRCLAVVSLRISDRRRRQNTYNALDKQKHILDTHKVHKKKTLDTHCLHARWYIVLTHGMESCCLLQYIHIDLRLSLDGFALSIDMRCVCVCFIRERRFWSIGRSVG